VSSLDVLLPRKQSGTPLTFGALRPWPSVLVTWGPGGESGLHAHHAMHIAVALDAEMQVRTSARGPVQTGSAVLTAPDARHALAITGRVLLAFVEPESTLGDQLRTRLGEHRVQLITARTTKPLRAALTPALSPERVSAVLPELFSMLRADTPNAPARHPGVMRVVRYLRSAPPDADTSLAALATLARLSEGRFMHAFTASVGVPLRPYLLWLKLERAAAALAGGEPLVQAALAAGFADAAHMTRTFKRMFGLTPSELQRRSQSVQEA
jgi:AraC-like DNA-binding protein